MTDLAPINTNHLSFYSHSLLRSVSQTIHPVVVGSLCQLKIFSERAVIRVKTMMMQLNYALYVEQPPLVHAEQQIHRLSEKQLALLRKAHLDPHGTAKRLMSSPELLQEVLDGIRLSPRRDLVRYETFIGDLLFESNPEACERLGEAVNIGEGDAGRIIQWTQRALESEKPLAEVQLRLTRYMEKIVSRSLHPEAAKQAILHELLAVLREGSIRLFKESNPLAEILHEQKDMSTPVLGNLAYIQNALGEIRQNRGNRFHTTMGNFAVGAALLSICKTSDFKHFLDDLLAPGKSLSRMRSLLLLPCFKLMKFKNKNDSFAEILENRLLQEPHIELRLLEELRSASSEESEALASLAFDLIRRGKGSQELVQAFMHKFYPVHMIRLPFYNQSLDFSDFFKYAAYLNKQEISMLAAAFHSRKQQEGKTAIEACSDFLKGLTETARQKQGAFKFREYKHPKWRDLSLHLFEGLSEQDKKEAWGIYLTTSSEEDLVHLLSCVGGGAPALLEPLAAALVSTSHALVWKVLGRLARDPYPKVLEPLVVLFFSSEQLIKALVQDPSLEERKHEYLSLLAVIMKRLTHRRSAVSAGWTPKNRLNSFHTFLRELSEEGRKFFLTPLQMDVGDLLFKGDHRTKARFMKIGMQHPEQISKTPSFPSSCLPSTWTQLVADLLKRDRQMKKMEELRKVADVLQACLGCPDLFPLPALQTHVGLPIDFQSIKANLEHHDQMQKAGYQEVFATIQTMSDTLKATFKQMAQRMETLAEEDIESQERIRIQVNAWTDAFTQGLDLLQQIEKGEESFTSSLPDLRTMLRGYFVELRGPGGLTERLEQKMRRRQAENTFEEMDGMLEEAVIYHAVHALKPVDDNRVEVHGYLDAHDITWSEISWLDAHLALPTIYDEIEGKYKRDFASFGIRSFEELKRTIQALKRYLERFPTSAEVLKQNPPWQNLSELERDQSQSIQG